MQSYLPDTNAFSEYARGNNAALAGKMDAALANKALILSSIVLAEMSYGWEKAGGTKRVTKQRNFAMRCQPQPFDNACARAYGTLKNFLMHTRARTHGNTNPIGERDMFIAAHALALGLTLVTRNTREFSKVPGLAVEDWSS